MSLGEDEAVVAGVGGALEVVAEVVGEEYGHQVRGGHRGRGVPGARGGGRPHAVHAQLLSEVDEFTGVHESPSTAGPSVRLTGPGRCRVRAAAGSAGVRGRGRRGTGGARRRGAPGDRVRPDDRVPPGASERLAPVDGFGAADGSAAFRDVRARGPGGAGRSPRCGASRRRPRPRPAGRGASGRFAARLCLGRFTTRLPLRGFTARLPLHRGCPFAGSPPGCPFAGSPPGCPSRVHHLAAPSRVHHLAGS